MRLLLTILAFCLATPLEAQDSPADIYVPSIARLDTTAKWVFPYAQPSVYMKWWSEIAVCSGLNDLPLEKARRIQFFGVNASSFGIPGIDDVLAVTYEDRGQIYMAYPFIWYEEVVKHEMLHMLLYWNGIDQGIDGHPDKYFTKCGMKKWGDPLAH